MWELETKSVLGDFPQGVLCSGVDSGFSDNLLQRRCIGVSLANHGGKMSKQRVKLFLGLGLAVTNIIKIEAHRAPRNARTTVPGASGKQTAAQQNKVKSLMISPWGKGRGDWVPESGTKAGIYFRLAQ